jgi:hypothetical protein
VTDRPDPATATLGALVALERRYRMPSWRVADGDAFDCPADQLAWESAAYAERQRRAWALDVSNPRGHVGVDPLDRRKDRHRKPGPPR